MISNLNSLSIIALLILALPIVACVSVINPNDKEAILHNECKMLGDIVRPSVEADLIPIVNQYPSIPTFTSKWQVDFLATDNCDDELDEMAVMKIPDVPADAVINYVPLLDLEYSEINFYAVSGLSFSSEAGMEIECKSADAEMLMALLEDAMENGGFSVEDDQILHLDARPTDEPGGVGWIPIDDPNGLYIEIQKQFLYGFGFKKGILVCNHAHGQDADCVLYVKAVDDHGNVAEKEVSLIQKIQELCEAAPDNVVCGDR